MKFTTKTLALIISLMLVILQLPAQAFDLNKFSNPKKYGWENYQDRAEYRSALVERQELLQLYEIKAKSITSTMAKSAVFPGWGHYSIESYTKGHTFLTGGVILAGAGLYFYSRSQDYYKNYKNASQIDDINSNFDKAEENYNTSMIFLAAYAILWGFNLYDSSESTERYNANLWENLTNNRFENLSLTPGGIEVKF
jgi:hypothetical protein